MKLKVSRTDTWASTIDDRPGGLADKLAALAAAGAKLTRALAEAGINLRGFSAAALGTRYVTHLALDTAQDAVKAAAALKKLS